MYTTENFKQDTFQPAHFESKGTITLKGKEIPYHTVSEDNVFYDKDGKALASIFSYSYFRDDVEDPASRPVLFCFNGGPGTSSMYVHAGFFGVKRIQYPDPVALPTSLPPFPIIDNPDCMLDTTDLVVIDPVGTGYGLLLSEDAKDQFYGIEEDAEALLTFIEKWLTKYNRWLSPKFLAGESYGCTRCATAVGMAAAGGKERSYAVRFDGVVLIGNTVAPGKYFREDLPVEGSVLDFPTYASINWYHNHPSDQTLEEFAYEAKAFADHDYLLALYKGEALSENEREEIIKKIHYYTNISREYLLANGLRIDEDTYRREPLKDRGLSVGRCDGRFVRDHYKPYLAEEKFGLWDDAALDQYDPCFFAALTGVILPGLNIKLDRNYVAALGVYRTWKKETTGGNTAERLRQAMNITKGMRVLFANGWYDACTQTGVAFYTMDHAGLPKDRVSFKGYPSGHMIYIGEDNCKALAEDLSNFILGK